MNDLYVWICVLMLFATTYFTRMLPLFFCKKQIKNTFVRSLLAYLPYAVLTSILIPEVFMKQYGLIPGILGFVVATILAYLDQNLIVVLSISTVVTYITMLFNPQINALFGI